MPRIPRIDLGNTIYHVINRSNARVEISHTVSCQIIRTAKNPFPMVREMPKDCLAYVNMREADEELKRIRYSVKC
ncbi:MAG: hypothetical protein Q8R30_00725 [bacterium]|nr:hypothetical protein [bacterium]